MRPRNGGAGRGTYGAYFNQFLLQSEQMALVPYLETTPMQMAQIDMLIASEEFVPPLATTPLPAASGGVMPGVVPAAVAQRLMALARGGDSALVGDGDEATILHPRTLIVSARAADVEERELAALTRLAGAPGVTRVDVDVFCIADAVSEVGAPTNVVDVTFFY